MRTCCTWTYWAECTTAEPEPFLGSASLAFDLRSWALPAYFRGGEWRHEERGYVPWELHLLCFSVSARFRRQRVARRPAARLPLHELLTAEAPGDERRASNLFAEKEPFFNALPASDRKEAHR